MAASELVPPAPEPHAPDDRACAGPPGPGTTVVPVDRGPLPGPVIRGPDDVVAAVPYLLGHHPSRSLVVLAVRPDAVLGVVCRADLPEPGAAPAAVDEVADQLVGAVTADGAERAVVVVYDDDPSPGPPAAAGPAEAVVDRLAGHGVGVGDVLHVGPRRWRSRWCSDHRCCPAEGRPLSEVRHRPVAARFVLEGRDPAPDRAALEPAP
ncbi:MAG: DUF4192 family protein, partial [Kineosporiaceae bacterium]